MTSFEHDGKTYALKMTRAGVRAAEAQGLSASQIADKPQSSLTLLFFAALFSQYKLNPNKASSMLDDLLDSGEVKFEELFEELSEEYVELFGLGESKE
jgi:hypothetical protein